MVAINKAFLTRLKKDPLAVLQSMSVDDVALLIQKANHEYYNKAPLFSDELFDIVKEYLEEKAPTHPILRNIGAAVASDDARKEELPYVMASLEKIKTDEKVLAKWVASDHTGPYVLSDKLDGISALLHWKGCTLKMYTRGDGKVGQNISHLLTLIRGIPQFRGHVEYAVRGELIMSKADFEKVKDKGANARNMVAGLVNAKTPDLTLVQLVQFVAYEVVHPKLKPSEQFAQLHASGFKVADHTLIPKDLSVDKLSDQLVKRRRDGEFEIDGIVVANDAIYKRTSGNPTYAFAFKSIHTMEQAEVLVTDVEWNLSKDGYLIPVVNFGGVRLDGVVIKRATGFNGKYIKDNKIGPGAKLVIIRSGQVIPYVKEVLKPSEPQMPEVPYVWSKSGVDIMLAKDQAGESTEVMKKNLENLFSKLDVAGMGPGTVKKLFDAGLTTPRAIFKATKADLLKADGIKDKSAEKIRTALDEALAALDCLKLMDASNVFGRGIGLKKLEAIVKTCPGILETREMPSMEELLAIKGIEKTTAEQFLTHLGSFFKFADDNDFKCASAVATKINKPVIGSPVPNVFAGMKIIFTGFRDKALEEFIVNRGGSITTSVSKNTSIVVCKDLDEDSGKMNKARDLGLKIMSVEEFKKTYKV